METYVIKIDLEIYQKIWAERRNTDESDNDILRRLLALPSAPGSGTKQQSVAVESKGRSWIWKGVTLEAGTLLHMEYLGRLSDGEVRDGQWWIGDKAFDTPSQAAKMLNRTREDKEPSLDGWKYWYIKRPSDDGWVLLDALRSGGVNNGLPHSSRRRTMMERSV